MPFLQQIQRPTQRPASWYVLAGIVFLVSSTSLIPVVHAQTLVGQWKLRQVTFMARQSLPDSLQEKLLGDSAAIFMNEQLKHRALTVMLELHADSTYRLQTTSSAHPTAVETGTYSMRHNTLRARTTTGQPALFDGQILGQLTRRALVWERPIWGDEYKVFRQLNYVRLK